MNPRIPQTGDVVQWPLKSGFLSPRCRVTQIGTDAKGAYVCADYPKQGNTLKPLGKDGLYPASWIVSRTRAEEVA